MEAIKYAKLRGSSASKKLLLDVQGQKCLENDDFGWLGRVPGPPEALGDLPHAKCATARTSTVPVELI